MVHSSQSPAAYRDPRFAGGDSGISTPMSGSLILLPLRVGVRVTGLAVRGLLEVVERAAAVAGLTHDDSQPDFRAAPDRPPTRTPAPPRPTQTRTAASPETAPAPVHRGEPVDYDALEPVVPAHIDDEDELVEEVAEPGAEDGAGAQVRIAEPWDGYRKLRAADVIDHLAAATAAELAAIELFELSSRRRRTVIAAARRELARRG
jgi:hypothetical protein